MTMEIRQKCVQTEKPLTVMPSRITLVGDPAEEEE